jgi:hypothetical protein
MGTAVGWRLRKCQARESEPGRARATLAVWAPLVKIA